MRKSALCRKKWDREPGTTGSCVTWKSPDLLNKKLDLKMVPGTLMRQQKGTDEARVVASPSPPRF